MRWPAWRSTDLGGKVEVRAEVHRKFPGIGKRKSHAHHNDGGCAFHPG